MDPSLKSKKNAFYTRKVIWFQPVLMIYFHEGSPHPNFLLEGIKNLSECSI
jgi:hypothetical protein